MALPEVIKNTINSSGESRGTSKFLDKFFSQERAKDIADNAKSTTAEILKREDKTLEQKMLIRKIAGNTDTIIDILRDINLNGANNKDSNWKMMLPMLAMLPGLFAPEITKAISTALKTALTAGKIADAATTAAKAAKAAKTADTVIGAAKAADTLTMGAKALTKVGALSNNKTLNQVSRFGSIGLIGGRAVQGDFTGAGLEGASLALSEASNKAKSPKAKIALAASSFVVDAGLMARDYFKKDDEDNGSGTILGGLGLAGAGVLASKLISKKTNLPPVASGEAIKEGAELVGKSSAASAIGKGAAKGLGKLIPGVGLAIGAVSAVGRARKGDYIGAAGEVAAGVASLIPVIGTAASAVISGGLLVRDIKKASTDLSSNTTKSSDSIRKVTEENSNTIGKSNSILKGNLSKTALAVASIVPAIGLVTALTTKFSGTVSSWLTSAKAAFASAVGVLSNAASNLWAKLKGFIPGIGGSDTSNPSNANTTLDTGKGEFALGKSGGTLAGSIMKAESGGDYGVYNVSDGKGGYKKGSVDNRAMTLDQVIGAQSSGRMNAFGAYQMIGTTTKEAKAAMGLTGKEKMTAELQDRIYKEYIIAKKRKKIKDYIQGVKGVSLNDAVMEVAKEWAGVGIPYDIKKGNQVIKKGMSYYSGIGGNKATTSPEEVGAALVKQRARYAELKNKGADNKTAYNSSFDINKEDSSLKEKAGAAVGTVTNAVGSIFKDEPKKTDPKTLTSPSGKAFVPYADAGKNKDLTQMNGGSLVKNANDKLAKNAGTAAIPMAKGVEAPREKQKGKDAEWDLDKLAATAYAQAKGKQASSNCALFVRRALEAAHIPKKFKGGIGHANQYFTSLPTIGWTAVGQNLTSFKKGDIAVFKSTGSESGKKHGHVCIFTGAVWVSDFVQKSVQPNMVANFPYTVFRAKNGISNGTPVGAPDTGIVAADKNDSTANAASGSDAAGGEEKSPLEAAMDAASKSISSISSMFAGASLDAAKSALDWVNSAKVDSYVQKPLDKVDLTGFDTTIKGQGKAYEYAFGNTGSVDEDKLFDPNLERQTGTDKDLLGEAGKINGIVRQQASKKDLLGEAGKINGVVRQKDVGIDLLGEAGKINGVVRQGDSNKKRKWYQRLFGDDPFSTIANKLGFGDIYSLGKDIAGADSKEWEDILGNKIPGMITKDDGEGKEGEATGNWPISLGGIFGNNQDIRYEDVDTPSGIDYGDSDIVANPTPIGEIVKDSEGIQDDYMGMSNMVYNPDGTRTYTGSDGRILTLDEDDNVISNVKSNPSESDLVALEKMPSTPIPEVPNTPQGSNPSYKFNEDGSYEYVSSTGMLRKVDAQGIITSMERVGTPSLSPDTDMRDKIDGYISSTNAQYNEFKNPTVSSNAGNDVMPVIPSISGAGGSSNKSGMSSPIVTRNPDSIFREVSIAMMRASTT